MLEVGPLLQPPVEVPVLRQDWPNEPALSPALMYQHTTSSVRTVGLPADHDSRELEDEMGSLILPVESYAHPSALCCPGDHVPVLMRHWVSKELKEGVALIL